MARTAKKRFSCCLSATVPLVHAIVTVKAHSAEEAKAIAEKMADGGLLRFDACELNDIAIDSCEEIVKPTFEL